MHSILHSQASHYFFDRYFFCEYFLCRLIPRDAASATSHLNDVLRESFLTLCLLVLQLQRRPAVGTLRAVGGEERIRDLLGHS